MAAILRPDPPLPPATKISTTPAPAQEKSDWLKKLETGLIVDPSLPQTLEAGKITAVYFTDMNSKWSLEFTPEWVAFRKFHAKDFQFVVSPRHQRTDLLERLKAAQLDAPCLSRDSPVRQAIIDSTGISGEDSPRLVIFSPDGKLISIKGRSIITGRNEVNQIDDKETYQKIWKEMIDSPERKP